MAYSKQTWLDNNPSTPLSAERLNHMEDGIEAANSVDKTLSLTSENPLQNKVIAETLGATESYFKTGDRANDDAPNSYIDIVKQVGLSFSKSALGGKGLDRLKTRINFFVETASYPRTVRVRVCNTNLSSVTENNNSTQLTSTLFQKDIVVGSNHTDINIPIAVDNSALSNVFAVVFADLTATMENKGSIYLSRSTEDGNMSLDNGGLYNNIGGDLNVIKGIGRSYTSYYNYYLELGYANVEIVKPEDLDNFIEKDVVGFGLHPNKNIWNITEQVESSFANPSHNGNIENYPEDNQYVQSYIRSGYLKVSPNTQYILSAYGDTSRRGRVFVCYYNGNKTFISGGEVNDQSSSAMIINGTTFTTPNNAGIRYMIMSISSKAAKPYQLEEGNVATPYQVYTGDKYEMGNLVINSDQIVDVDTPTSYINLPNELYAVVGDTFEMFYKGILNLKSFEGMYVECVCDIGYSYQRKFKCTPVAANIGNHNLTIKVYNNNKTLIDSKTIVLKVVAKATSPSSNKNILCMGDSLTAGGTWVAELHRRINLSNSVAPNGDEAPTGLGLSNITFIGKKITSNGAGYEGFGGWRFSNYLDPSTSTEDYWITSTTHNKTDADQESIWQDTNGTKWQLETIETNRLKMKKYSGSGAMPANGTLTWISGGSHTDNITYTYSELAEGNPFAYNGSIDFSAYCADLGISTIDEVYILLGWNNYATDKATYKAEAKQFIDLLRAFNANIKITLMGLEIPSADGLAHNYGADGTLTYVKQQQFVFDINDLYQEIADEYASGVYFVNVASQFDTEYCMPTIDTTPNSRVFTQIKQQSNGVHPAAPGYYQIADIMYRWMNAKIGG